MMTSKNGKCVRQPAPPGGGSRKRPEPGPRTCFRCAYAQRMRPCRAALRVMDWVSHLMCVNSEAAPGEFREVRPTGTCRNFRARQEPPVRVQPPEPPNDQIKYVALTKGQYAIVDAADFERVNQYKWCAARASSGSGYYAVRREAGRTILMHREILNAPDDMSVDHINRQPSDNR